jgi:hypothetical protein
VGLRPSVRNRLFESKGNISAFRKKTAFIKDEINSTQARDQCLEYANRLIYFQFPQEAGNFSTAVVL